MKVGMLGMGKLGLPVALAIESRGHEVYGYDVNQDIQLYLEAGEIPYREEGLQPLLFATELTWCESVDDVLAACELVFVAVQTPHDPEFEGSTMLPEERKDFDYSYLKAALRDIDEWCTQNQAKRTIAVISTCLPGTFQREIRPIVSHGYVDYVYTPQFIAMGTVLQDYLFPEFNLIGSTVDGDNAATTLELFYKTINDAPMVKTDVTTAEGIKLSYNTIITAKTVIANSWGELSERLGMNFDDIQRAWDLSTRRLLSGKYLSAGMSDGGGCHPRDNIAMSHIAKKYGMSHNLWEDLMASRQSYEEWHARTAAALAVQANLPLILLGRAFKPETDIETGSPALLMADILKGISVEFEHINELPMEPRQAVYFIATQNMGYPMLTYPKGSIIIDPFGYMLDMEGVYVHRLGRP